MLSLGSWCWCLGRLDGGLVGNGSLVEDYGLVGDGENLEKAREWVGEVGAWIIEGGGWEGHGASTTTSWWSAVVHSSVRK